MVQIQSLARELPHVTRVAKKKKKAATETIIHFTNSIRFLCISWHCLALRLKSQDEILVVQALNKFNNVKDAV